MDAIVMNTLTGAVTEYDNYGFHAATPTHAGNATGLYAFGGDLDVAQPIVAEAVTGETLWGDSRKKFLDMVYFSIPDGEGRGELIVHGAGETEHRYDFPFRSSGQSRAKPGKGIRENYLAFGFSNPDGDDFTLDRIEVLVAQSKTRRV